MLVWLSIGGALALAMPNGTDRLFALGWGGTGLIVLQIVFSAHSHYRELRQRHEKQRTRVMKAMNIKDE
jgi:hypothetical protein